MNRVVEDVQVKKYHLIRVDGERPKLYNRVVIGGDMFEIVPTHNLDEYVAIETNVSHLGENVEFIML